MTKQKKEFLEVAAVGGGLIIIYLLLSRGNMTPSATTLPEAASPNYLTYNQSNPDSVPLSNEPTITGIQPSTPNAPACQSCAATPISFSGIAGFEQSLQNTLGDIVNTYEEDMLNQVPDYVSQFFNNLQGSEDDVQAQTQFAGMYNSIGQPSSAPGDQIIG